MGKKLKNPKNVSIPFRTDAVFAKNLTEYAKIRKKSLSAFIDDTLKKAIDNEVEIMGHRWGIAAYETPELKQIFSQLEGKSADFMDATGAKYSIKINRIQDVVLMMAECYKIHMLMVKKYKNPLYYKDAVLTEKKEK